MRVTRALGLGESECMRSGSASPMDAPFFVNIPRYEALDVAHEWMLDELPLTSRG